jgi:hypothetical protein
VAPNNRSEEAIAVSAQMGSNYARKEVQGESVNGWSVDVVRQWCPCDYWFGFSACIHVLFTLRVTAHVDSSGRECSTAEERESEAELLSCRTSDGHGQMDPA